MNRNDYDEISDAMRLGLLRLDGALEPGGSLNSIDPADVRRVIAVLADGMADSFSMGHPRFDSDAFLDRCGLLAEVEALTNSEFARQMGGEPIDDAAVKTGDRLYYLNSAGNHCLGDVTKVTDRFVTLGRDGWDMDQDLIIRMQIKLPRSHWSLHHVRLVNPADVPPKPRPLTAAQAFPEPPRPDTPRVSSTDPGSVRPLRTAQPLRRPASR